jgi:hypothetical protein
MSTSYRFCRALIHLAFPFAFLFSHSLSQWSTDPYLNTGICTESHSQAEPAIVSDGAGGVIISWTDLRNGIDFDIYAQRVNADGVMLWTVDGVPISTAAGDQTTSSLISDGSGGAIITWHDRRRGGSEVDIYAQRVNGSGQLLWNTDGVVISRAVNFQIFPNIVSDGTGGAIIAWDDYRRGVSGYNIFAQRVDAAGIQQWDSNGVVVSTEVSNQGPPPLVSDLAGGAIIAWSAEAGGSLSDIRAQRVNSLGAVQWDSIGVAICTAADAQASPSSVSDSVGGSIIAWMDFRHGNMDIYAQRVNIEGVVMWDSGGVALTAAAGNQTSPELTGDGAHGAVVTWQDANLGPQSSIYVQRVDASGNVKWDSNGVLIAKAWDNQWPTAIATDGAGGAIIAWDNDPFNYSDIYAQRVNGTGAIQWTANGIPVCLADKLQIGPAIAVDRKGGGIITWVDLRKTSQDDIYAQLVDSDGRLGGVTDVQPLGNQASLFQLYQNYPNPFNPSTTIQFSIADPQFTILKIFDLLGREVSLLVSEKKTPGNYSVMWNAEGLASGVYFCRLQVGNPLDGQGHTAALIRTLLLLR